MAGRGLDRLVRTHDGPGEQLVAGHTAETPPGAPFPAHNGHMKARTLRVQIIAGAVVAVLLAVAVPVIFVAIREGTAAVRAGDGILAAQAGLVALVAAVVGVVALATYAHWLSVTERPRRPRRRHVPAWYELALVGLVVLALAVGVWPVVTEAYGRSIDAFRASDLSWTVGYAVLGALYVWLVLVSIERYVLWVRHRER